MQASELIAFSYWFGILSLPTTMVFVHTNLKLSIKPPLKAKMENNSPKFLLTF